MRHEQFQDNLSSYVDGTLDPALTTAMDRHTGDCPSCARELAEMRRVYSLLASPMMDVEPPPSYHDNVMRKVRLAQREREKSPRGVFARLGWGWTAASGVAVVALLMAVVLSVGPLGDGLTAGFGLNRPPVASFAQPSGEISVAFPGSVATAGLDFPVSVRVLTPSEGEWRLLARPAGLTLASSAGIDPRGDVVLWHGPVAAGQTARIGLHLYPSDPGRVGTVDLRLERVDGFTAARETIFVPTAGRSGGMGENVNPANASLRDALTEYAALSRRPISAPTEALDAAVSGADAAMSIEALAGHVGLTVRPAGAGFALNR